MGITIKELPDYEVAFIRNIGSYLESNNHWESLLHWAFENGLYPPTQSFIGISLDNPDIVEAHNCRHDACVTIPKDFEKEQHRDIQFKTIEGGQYALYHFYDTPDKLKFAYQYVFNEWLPTSKYDADFERDNLELNMNNPADDSEGKSKVDLYVAIRRACSKTNKIV